MTAMDETTAFMSLGSQKTIDQKGTSPIYIDVHWLRKCTCILVVYLDGRKTSPLINTNGTKDKTERVSCIYVLETVKAWCTQAVIMKWVDVMLTLVLRGGHRGLLVWDSASIHCNKDIKIFLAERKDQNMIPAEITSYLLTLDIDKTRHSRTICT